MRGFLSSIEMSRGCAAIVRQLEACSKEQERGCEGCSNLKLCVSYYDRHVVSDNKVTRRFIPSNIRFFDKMHEGKRFKKFIS